jgi:hypothetical protein
MEGSCSSNRIIVANVEWFSDVPFFGAINSVPHLVKLRYTRNNSSDTKEIYYLGERVCVHCNGQVYIFQ